MLLFPCSISEARQLQSERERRKEQRSEVNNFISGNPIGELVWVVASYLAASQQWDSLNKRRETRGFRLEPHQDLNFIKLRSFYQISWSQSERNVKKKWVVEEQGEREEVTGGQRWRLPYTSDPQSENSTPASNPLSPQALSHTSCTYKRMKPTQKSEVDFDDSLFPMILFSCRKGSHCGCSVRL